MGFCEYKKASVIAIVGIIAGILILAGAGTGYYLYEYHTFKTLRFCISQDMNESLAVPYNCDNNGDCVEFMKNKMQEQLDKNEIKEIPLFLEEKLNMLLEKSAYCKQLSSEDIEEALNNTALIQNKEELKRAGYNISQIEELSSRQRDEIVEKLENNKTCMMKKTRGFDIAEGNVKEIERCNDDEEEIIVEIHGKEGLIMLEWLDKNKDKF